MVKSAHKENARHLRAELDWLCRMVETRYKLHHHEPCPVVDLSRIRAPVLNGSLSIYQRFVDHFQLTWQERLVLVLALLPHIQPHALDDFLGSLDPDLPTRASANGNASAPPTVETALFLLAGDDLEKRFLYQQIFNPDAALIREQVLILDCDLHRPSPMSARILVAPEYISLFTTGKELSPVFNEEFPAKRITTLQNWNDLVLNSQTLTRVEEIKSWVRHGDTLLGDWGLGRKFAPGYTCLFHGPPGTGKTTTAALLGQFADLDVYLVDLSMVASRYVGEASKSIGRLFDRSRNHRWLLFFDECESLFSKRSEAVKDSQDRWSNQEISYILQRLDDHPGIVILATNMMQHVDDAFLRRFQSVIEFPMPSPEQRLELWGKGFSDSCKLDEAIDLEQIAGQYELAGGSIMNVIRHASLMALERGGNIIHRDDLLRGIQRELEKEGRSF